MAAHLVEIDSLEALVIIDNELDIFTPPAPNTVSKVGNVAEIAMATSPHIEDRGECSTELRMDKICCGAWGLSILLTATNGDAKHSLLFDTGPEEEAWERNVNRLNADISKIETIHLSHWHRDHSGGMLKAISMILSSQKENPSSPQSLTIDLHPNRPTYRGFKTRETIISMEADPNFSEITSAGALVTKNPEAHTVLSNQFLISGYIPRTTPYETGLQNGARFDPSTEKWEPDAEMADERFLVCNLKGKGLVLLTGCSHSGVVNAARAAVDMFEGKIPLHAVMGGFHLSSSSDAQVKETVKDLQALNPKILLPGHCSGWKVKFEIEREMPGRLVPCTVGSKFVF